MGMKNPIWTHAIEGCADPQRARHFLDLLMATSASAALQASSAEQARILAALFSGTQALSNLLVARPDWLGELKPEMLKFPRRKQGMRNEVSRWLKPLLAASDFGAVLTRLREFKQREMMRIAGRDLARLANLQDIIQEISDVADVCLDGVWQVCFSQLVGRYGQPWHQDADSQWQPTAGCVLGMGKLGGQELNYSSDVDVMFAYSEEGSVVKEPPGKDKTPQPTTGCVLGMGKLGGQELNYSSDVDVMFAYSEEGSVFKEPPGKDKAPQPTLTSHQFFNRLAETFIAEVSRMTPEGTLYRIDLRLRPEGDTGPLSRSLAGYENYYAQWGQTWERMMLIKARGAAGDAALAAEFVHLIKPFRYPRSINESVLGEVVAMKGRIENEVVKAGELERNVKLGRGGIREIEFMVQALQLLRAGRQPFLQGAQTLASLSKLVQYELLSADESSMLAEAYCFLRDVEHRLQMENNLQTHTIPTDRHAQERLARLMGFATLGEFKAAHQAHTHNVRRIFDRLLKADVREGEAPSPFPRQFEGAEGEWKKLLAQHAFKDVEKAFRVLREFVEGPGYVHVSPRTSDLAYQLLPKLFALCPQPKPGAAITGSGKPPQTTNVPLSDPDRVVTRLDSFISAYGARVTLFELWNRNPTIFELLALLFDRSEFLAELAIRTPDLVDELVISGRLRQRKSAEETLRDLRHGLGDEDQRLWLRRYHQAELMRIGLRDILGLAGFEQDLMHPLTAGS